MQYRIFNKRRKVYLDANLFYVNQKGFIMKMNSPFPLRVENQEDYEIRLVEPIKVEDKTNE